MDGHEHYNQPSSSRQTENFRVLRVQTETADTVSVILGPETASNDFIYHAGQYLNLWLDITGQTLVRCYSFSSAPHETDLRITVKRVPGGQGSSYLNSQPLIGEHLLGSRPQGTFTLRDSSRAFLGLAAGSGITPVISILKHMLHSTLQPCLLFYVTPHPEQTIFHNELELLRQVYPKRLIVQYWHTRLHGPFAGERAQRLLLDMTGNMQPDVYVCGPTAWMNLAQRWVQTHIKRFGNCYHESFSEAVSSTTASVDVGARHEVIIHLSSTSHRLMVGGWQSILAAARASGLELPSGCELGKCGGCMARCLSGEVDVGSTDFLTPAEIRQGYVLCCQAKPRSACVLSLD